MRAIPPWNISMLTMAEHISLTFAFYSDCNLDFVVILHEVVQLNWLLSIESQRFNISP